MPSPLASVVIVSYNTRDKLRACLESVAIESAGLDHEVIVLDNASSDGSAAMVRAEFPSIRLIARAENAGFARGVNEAVDLATGEFVILLNPDTIVLDNALTRLVGFAQAHPEYGLYGGRTLDAQGVLAPSSCWGAPTVWSLTCFALGLSTMLRQNAFFDPESLGRWQRDTVREVGVVTGCLLLARRDWFVRLGGFDERFFMYGEDADLSSRSAAAGRPNVITPTATIIHSGGASSPNVSGKLVQIMTAKATLVRKWPGPLRAYALGALVVGVWLRALLSEPPWTPARGAKPWGAAHVQRRAWISGFDAPDRQPVFARPADTVGDPVVRPRIGRGSCRVKRGSVSINTLFHLGGGPTDTTVVQKLLD